MRQKQSNRMAVSDERPCSEGRFFINTTFRKVDIFDFMPTKFE